MSLFYFYNNFILSNTYNHFSTDHFINGEQFYLNTKNQYFCIINNNYQLKDLNQLTHFHPSSYLDKLNYDSTKHVIIRLKFNKNKKYFVESNQAITIENPDVTILHNITSIKELLLNIPKFIDLPH